MEFKTAAILSLLSILAVCLQANSHELLDPDTLILNTSHTGRSLHGIDEVIVPRIDTDDDEAHPLIMEINQDAETILQVEDINVNGDTIETVVDEPAEEISGIAGVALTDNVNVAFEPQDVSISEEEDPVFRLYVIQLANLMLAREITDFENMAIVAPSFLTGYTATQTPAVLGFGNIYQPVNAIVSSMGTGATDMSATLPAPITVNSTDEISVHVTEEAEKATAASNRSTGSSSLNGPSYQVNYQLQGETQRFQKPTDNINVTAVQPRRFIGATGMDSMLPVPQITYSAPYTYTSQQPFRDPSSPYHMQLPYSQLGSAGLKETPSAAVADRSQLWPHEMSYANPQVGGTGLGGTPPEAVTDNTPRWPYDKSHAYPQVSGIGLEYTAPPALNDKTPKWPYGMSYAYPQVGGTGLGGTPPAAVTGNTPHWPYDMSYTYPQVGSIGLEDTPPAAVNDKALQWPYGMSYAYPQVGGTGLRGTPPAVVTDKTPHWPNGMPLA